MKKSFGARTLVYPTPVWCVGSYDRDDKPNVMTAAWGGICCSDPPCVTVSIRKNRHSYDSIIARKAYTVNVASEKYVREADYFGMASGKNVDKFRETGLTPVKSELVDAPYIAEFPMILECKLLHTYDIGIHTLFVGQIMDVKADGDLLTPDGSPDIEKIRPLIFSPGTQVYHGVGQMVGKAFSIGKELDAPLK